MRHAPDHKNCYREYVSRMIASHPGEKVALAYDKWLPLHQGGLA